MRIAKDEAQHYNRVEIDTEHLLLALAREGRGVAGAVLKDRNADAARIRVEIEKIAEGDRNRVGRDTSGESVRLKRVIDYSMEEAMGLNHNYVGTEHLLLGLLREPEGAAMQVLATLGLSPADVRQDVLDLLGHGLA